MKFSSIREILVKDFQGLLSIRESYLDFKHIDGKECICFADDKDSPEFYVIANSLEYRENEYNLNNYKLEKE